MAKLSALRFTIIAPNLHPLLAGESHGYGGAELDCKNILDTLLDRGWSATILTQTNNPSPLQSYRDQQVRVLTPRPSGQHRAKNPILALLQDLFYIFRFAMALARLPPGIWITKLAGLQSLLVLFLGRLRGLPVVFRFGHDGETDLDHLITECFQGRAALARRFLAELPQCATILTQTRHQAQLLQQRRPEIPPALVITIPNAHPAPPFSPRPFDPQSPILWISRGDPVKNPGLFLDALAQIDPCPPARMIMPPSGFHDRFHQSMAERAAQQPALSFLPGLPHKSIAQEYQRALLFVMTSQAEGLPNVLLEALQYGLPILTTTINPDGLLAQGLPDPHQPDPCGWCVGDDPLILAQAIQILRAHPELWTAAHHSARKTFEENFDLRRIGDTYHHLLQRLLSPQKS